uniref:Uncharacterized protein n=1 Tax=Anguilla anguilla TaxID=7936 RepID=A0A0E9WH06_ANGAN
MTGNLFLNMKILHMNLQLNSETQFLTAACLIETCKMYEKQTLSLQHLHVMQNGKYAQHGYVLKLLDCQ